MIWFFFFCNHIKKWYNPRDRSVKLKPNQGEPYSYPRRHRRLVGKLNYLVVTRPHIAFVVSVVSQLLNSSYKDYWDVIIRIWKYIKKANVDWVGSKRDRLNSSCKDYWDAIIRIWKYIKKVNVDWVGLKSDRFFISGECVTIRNNLISWKSKKQNIVVRSYNFELIWLKLLIKHCL